MATFSERWKDDLYGWIDLEVERRGLLTVLVFLAEVIKMLLEYHKEDTDGTS